MARIPKALLKKSNNATSIQPTLDQLDADSVVDPVINDVLNIDVAPDIKNDLNIPEDEITAWHGSPHDFPAVTEIVSYKTGERVLVDKIKYPDWTQQPDINAADYEFVSEHALGKFDSSKIGTGEGAQAYGHGLYFAQRKGTAESYQKGLRKSTINKETPELSRSDFNNITRDVDAYLPSTSKEKFSLDSLFKSNKNSYFKSGKVTNAEAYLYSFFQDIENAEASLTLAKFEIDARLDDYKILKNEFQNPSPVGSAEYNKAESIASKLEYGSSEKGVDAKIKNINNLKKEINNVDLSKFEEGKGSLMEVKIKAKEEEFLDFDAILDDQEFALQLLESDRGNFEWALDSVYNEGFGFNPTGKDLMAVLGDSLEPAEVSASLNKAGIKGIKYKDAQTRFSSKGATYNYVVFDDKLISIANKYSISLFAAGSVSLGLMTPQEAMAQENPIGAPQPPIGTPESAANNTSNNYLEYRESVVSKEVQEANKRKAEYEATQKSKDSTPVAVAKDIGKGVFGMKRSILTGMANAVVETQETFNGLFGLDKDFTKADITKAVLESQRPDNESITSGMIEGISQFLTGFLPSVKALQVTGKAGPYIAGAIADATVFDEHEARLADWIEQNPDYSNPVTRYLQSDPEDSMAEGKLKLAVEGFIFGMVGDVLVKSITTVKRWKDVKAEASANGMTPEEFVGPIKPEELTDGVSPLRDEDQEFIPFDKIAEENGAVIKTPAKMGKGEASDEAAQNINLDRLQTTDEVKELIDAVATAIPKKINNARREVITNEETAKLADELGMTVEDLLNRREGSAPSAEEAVAARNILIASAENLIRLSQKAENGGDVEIALFRRAMSQHEAIQLTVSGMTAEAGRALQSFRILAQSSKEQIQMIKESIESSGGMAVNQAIARRAAEIGAKNKGALGRYVRKASKATTVDMVTEIYINALLSGLPTHAINILSNASVVLNTVLERKIAGIFGNEIESGEAAAQMIGIVEGAKDGFRLAKHAMRTGESSDVMQKQDLQNQTAISAKDLELTGTSGKAADFLGNTIRLAGRALLASDEFFKAIAYRMEINALAYRTAMKENLSEEDFVKRVAELTENPPSNIKMEADAIKRYQTFTNPLGETGRKFQNLRNSDNPAIALTARLIMPFVRTPVNVIKYSMARTPLALLMPTVREDFLAGGARKELVLARVALGSTMMAVSSMLSHQGIITGNGPANYKDRQTLELSGWKPNSILISGKYYSIDRLDPIADIVLMSANITEILGQVEEAERQDLATASIISVSQMLINGTFFNGLVSFFDAVASMNADPNPKNENRVLMNWVSGRGTSFIPTMVGVIERKIDPTVRLTNDLTSKLKAKTPGYSEDLPPRRNIFGDPIILEGGLGPDIMSPIYKSTKKYDDVVDQMIENKVDIGNAPWTIEGIKLTLEEYDRYVQLSAGLDASRNLHQSLKKLLKSSIYKKSTSGRDGAKALLIEQQIIKFREMARKKMKVEFPSLNSRILSDKFQKQEALTGNKYSDQFQKKVGVLEEDLSE